MYVFFAAQGLNVIIEKTKKYKLHNRELIGLSVLLLPFIYVPTMLFGFAGQLKTVDYPKSWYNFNEKLKREEGNGKILFLPWSLYMSYDFTPRVIANPSDRFFERKTIYSNNAEFSGIKSPHKTSDQKFIEERILAQKEATYLGQLLAEIDVEYVLLSKGFNHEQYGFLDSQTDLKLTSSQNGLKVYKNEAYNK